MKLDSSQIGNWQAFTKFGEKSSIIMSTARKRINPQKLGKEKAPRHIQDTYRYIDVHIHMYVYI